MNSKLILLIFAFVVMLTLIDGERTAETGSRTVRQSQLLGLGKHLLGTIREYRGHHGGGRDRFGHHNHGRNDHYGHNYRRHF